MKGTIYGNGLPRWYASEKRLGTTDVSRTDIKLSLLTEFRKF